jgi:hypothetical protein
MAPSKLGIKAGGSVSAEQAILALVTKSANDVAAAVGEHLGGTESAFAKMMTAKARALGMDSTVFRNASGLPASGQLTTARDMARRWYGPAVADGIAVVPLVRPLPPVADRAAARRALGWDPDALVVCSFGIVAAAKLHHRILAAWGGSRLRARPEARLVFAGDGDSDYGIDLARAIVGSGDRDRVSITGWIDDATFATMLVATDMAVQLRSASRGETSGAVLDAMAVGRPVIVNAHGTLAELPADAVVRLPEHFDDADLAAALDRLVEDVDLRDGLGRRGREAVAANHAPRVVADLYRDAIEAIHARGRFSSAAVVAAIADIPGYAPDAGERAALAEALAVNHPPPWPVRRLWLDTSGLEGATEGDWLRDRLLDPPEGWRIEPIEAAPDGSGWRRADALAARVLDLPWVPPAAVEPVPGDVVLLAGENLAGHDAVALLDQHGLDHAPATGRDLDDAAFDIGLAVGDGRVGAGRGLAGLGRQGLLVGRRLVLHEQASADNHHRKDGQNPEPAAAQKAEHEASLRNQWLSGAGLASGVRRTSSRMRPSSIWITRSA